MQASKFTIPSSQSVEIVMQYSLYKKGRDPGTDLGNFIQMLLVLPVSSAACERGFSEMNLHHTVTRNRLHFQTVNDLMMISMNGPPLTKCNCRKYVLSYLK